MFRSRSLMVLVSFVFTTLFLGSAVYADWPPSTANIVPGYAQIDDSVSYQFRSDGLGHYTDVHISGNPGEKVELALDGGDLVGMLLYLGKPEPRSTPTSPLGEPPYNCSPRKSNFWFDIIEDGKTTASYKKYADALDILAYTDSSKTSRRGNSVGGGKYYLNNDIVRLVIRRWLDDSGGIVHDLIFTIEPSETPCEGCGEGAVTQTAIDDFTRKGKNVDYGDAKQARTSDCDLVIYRISFDSDFSIVKAPGKSSTWIISGSGKAHLGPLLSNGIMVGLVDYNSLSFSATVSTTYPFSAPPRQDTTATLWGEMKLE